MSDDDRPTLQDLLDAGDLLCSVPQAGWIANRLGKSASYSWAAKKGLPIVTVGARHYVVVKRLADMLGVDPGA